MCLCLCVQRYFYHLIRKTKSTKIKDFFKGGFNGNNCEYSLSMSIWFILKIVFKIYLNLFQGQCSTVSTTISTTTLASTTSTSTTLASTITVTAGKVMNFIF